MIRPIIMKFGTGTHIGLLNVPTVKFSKILKSKMADGCRFEKSRNRHESREWVTQSDP